MSKIFVVALVLISLCVGRAAAQPICEDGYGLCMRSCADDQQAERCMQRCQEAAQRCERSGVFKMPIGFKLNKRRLEDMSYGQSELPRSAQRNEGSRAAQRRQLDHQVRH